MSKSIEHLRSKVQRLVCECILLVEADKLQRARHVERELWKKLLALGLVLFEMYLLRQAQRWPQGLDYLSGAKSWCVAGATTSWVGTMFGKVKFVRPVGRERDNPRAACDKPVDRGIGLIGQFTPGVVFAITRLTAQLAFGSTHEVFKRVHGWAPAPRSILRMVDTMGAEVKPFWAAAPAPQDDGEIVVVEVDPKGVPMINSNELKKRRKPKRQSRRGETRRGARRRQRRENPKKRRAPGKKAKNARMAVLGVVYTLKRTATGVEGPINKRVYTTFLGMEALFRLLKREVDKRGGASKELLFMADGQRSIWDLQARFFPDARTAVDWWHIAERIWEAATLIHGEGNKETSAFVGDQLWCLRQGQAGRVIAELKRQRALLPASGPGTRWRRGRLGKIINYLQTNQPRMNYLGNRRRDLPIGTGMAEGAVRHVLGTRLDNSGMRWSLDRAEMVAGLRCILVNGEWDAFEDYVDDQSVCLPTQPLPTRPYDAKPCEAA